MILSFGERAALLLCAFVIFGIRFPGTVFGMIGSLFRFLSGQLMAAKPRTNSTFMHGATRILGEHDHASVWQKLPGWKRAAYRIGVSTGLIVLLYLRFAHPLMFRSFIACCVLSGGTVGYFKGRALWSAYQHKRNIVNPIHAVLAPRMGIPAYTAPETWITVPENYADDDKAEVLFRLPDAFAATAMERKELPPIIASKLGGEWDEEWRLVGRAPTLIFKHAPNPPDSVRLNDLRDAMLAAPEHAPVLGMGTHGSIISVNLNSDSPHIAFSMGSGGGKSTAVRTLACQMYRNGARLICIDVAKRGVSHRWLKSLPNAEIHRTAESAHKALVRLGQEMSGRFEEIFEDETAEQRFQRIGIIFEELNATMHLLEEYWAEVREKTDPKKSPAIRALADILFAGRQGRITVIMVAQMLTSRALGGPEMRENFAFRILCRYTLNAWKMLCPEVWPAPRSSSHVGRSQVVTGGMARACQVAYFTDSESIEWALSGDRVVPVVQSVLTVSEGTVTTHDPVPSDESATPVVRRYTVGQAASASVVPLSYDALKKARQRDPEFPTGEDGKYTEAELVEWFANRESTARKGR